MEREQQRQVARDLRARGWRQVQIAAKMGVHQTTVSRLLNPPPQYSVEADRSAAALGVLLDNSGPTLASTHARRQEAREQRHQEAVQRSYLARPVSFESASDKFNLRERLADPSRLGQDPFTILSEIGASKVLGDLTIEDVERMDEYELGTLREQLLAAGVAPPSVQRAERDRLKVTTPHHGKVPARIGRVGMAGTPKRRTRDQRSARHKIVDRRFRRKQKDPAKQRDGWGGVVVPDEGQQAA